MRSVKTLLFVVLASCAPAGIRAGAEHPANPAAPIGRVAGPPPALTMIEERQPLPLPPPVEAKLPVDEPRAEPAQPASKKPVTKPKPKPAPKPTAPKPTAPKPTAPTHDHSGHH